MQVWHVYVLSCSDGSLYTGVTTDLRQRLRQHNGEVKGGARYTRSRRPVQLVRSWEAFDKSSAFRAEKLLKSLPRRMKLQILDECADVPFEHLLTSLYTARGGTK